MEIKSLIQKHIGPYMSRYGSNALPEQLKALRSMQQCRTSESGELYARCPDCHHGEWRPLSCGNRHCPKCLNHQTSSWLDKQQAKLMPVPYFLATFTLPYELRYLAYGHQKTVYSILFESVAEVLRTFAANPKHLGAEIGMTMVLHTHARDLSYHPHIHVLIPGGGIHKRLCKWIRVKNNYLFNGFALAKMFRGKFLTMIRAAGLTLPDAVPAKWVAHCDYVGNGLPALKYLAKYLYRGVISEKNIVAMQDDTVTFRYRDSTSGEFRYRTLKGEVFLSLIVKHVLPKGFRRVRDYGFLHGNASKIRTLIQLILHVFTWIQPEQRQRPKFSCPKCKAAMKVTHFRFDYGKSG
jgi:hypothetical protein